MLLETMEAQTLDYFLPGILTQDAKKRIETGEGLVSYLRNALSSMYCLDMSKFVNGLTEWLSDSNIKVSLQGQEILSCLIDRMGEHFRPYIITVLPAAVERLGDSNDQVRESAKVLLLKLMKPASSPQYIFDRLSIAFTHKLWKVREETLLFLQKALNDFGAKSLGFVVPTVVKLLDDKSIAVREQAINTLVEVYHHVGESVRSDLAKLEIDQTRRSEIWRKMDEVKNSGGMLATDSLTLPVREGLAMASTMTQEITTCRCGRASSFLQPKYCQWVCKKFIDCGVHLCNLRCCVKCRTCNSEDHGDRFKSATKLQALSHRHKFVYDSFVYTKGKDCVATLKTMGLVAVGKGYPAKNAREAAASKLLKMLKKRGISWTKSPGLDFGDAFVSPGSSLTAEVATKSPGLGFGDAFVSTSGTSTSLSAEVATKSPGLGFGDAFVSTGASLTAEEATKSPGLDFGDAFVSTGASLTAEVATKSPGLGFGDAFVSTSTSLSAEVAMESEDAPVFTRKQKKVTERSVLPIDNHRLQITNYLKKSRTMIIIGNTGCGKSTRVPQYLYEDYDDPGHSCNIIVTQPRRLGTISLSHRVSFELHSKFGDICGYQVAMDTQAGKGTRILFCTTGVLVEKLARLKNLNRFSHIVLDEVHERSKDMDFCLLLVKKLLKSTSRNVKVILMSATMDAKIFMDYFTMEVNDDMQCPPVVEVEGITFKVSEVYLDDLQTLKCTIPTISASKAIVSKEAIALAVHLIQSLDAEEQDSVGTVSSRGSALVFLPGVEEIHAMASSLKKIEKSQKLEIHLLHSGIESHAPIFQQPAEGCRKVILSTNIAESSVTIQDVKYIIDFCLTRTPAVDEATGFSQLQLQWASKASCIQRKGRAGRVSSGTVFRLIHRSFWDIEMCDTAAPEMQRCSLDDLILKIKVLQLGQPEQLLRMALSPPKLETMNQALLVLIELGALDMDGNATYMGKLINCLPLNCKLGKLVFLGLSFGILDETIIISACLSVPSFFILPGSDKAEFFEAYKSKYSFSNDSQSDCVAFLNAFKEWKKVAKTQELKWGKENFVNIKRIHEVNRIVSDIYRKLAFPRPKILPLEQADNEIILKVLLAGAFLPHVFLLEKPNEDIVQRELLDYDRNTTVMVKGRPDIHFCEGLHAESLKHFFHQRIGMEPKVFFEDKRAFVEFKQASKSKEGVVASGVHLAIKMRILDLPRSLPSISEAEVQVRLAEIKNQERPQATDLRTACRDKERRAILEAAPTSCEEIYLNGPFHPCTVGIAASVSSSRHINIDKGSTNSVIFNVNSGKASQGLTAALTCLNSSGELTLRHTTILPCIPGFYGNVVMLFCQKAELRTDKDRKKFTGAICGLGPQNNSAQPLYPEHDIELLFETDFDMNDLQMINGIRLPMYAMMDCGDLVAEFKPDDIRRIQSVTRQNLLDLIHRTRKNVVNEPFSRRFQWGQVEARDIFKPKLKEELITRFPHLQLYMHSGIALNMDPCLLEDQQMSCGDKAMHQSSTMAANSEQS